MLLSASRIEASTTIVYSLSIRLVSSRSYLVRHGPFEPRTRSCMHVLYATKLIGFHCREW